MQLTLEAVDVADDRVLWQEAMNLPVEDLVAMREQITSKVRQGLIPALGARTEANDKGTRPTNEEAYDLYLRSVALAHDGEQNREAVRMLERSVDLIRRSLRHGRRWARGITTKKNMVSAPPAKCRARNPRCGMLSLWIPTWRMPRSRSSV